MIQGSKPGKLLEKRLLVNNEIILPPIPLVIYKGGGSLRSRLARGAVARGTYLEIKIIKTFFFLS